MKPTPPNVKSTHKPPRREEAREQRRIIREADQGRRMPLGALVLRRPPREAGDHNGQLLGLDGLGHVILVAGL
jgi:hypothetical protein